MSVQRRHVLMIYFYLLLNFVLCEEDVVPPRVKVDVEIPPVIGQSEVPLATCTAAQAWPEAQVSWDVGDLDSVREETRSAGHPDGTVTVTSHLMGVPFKNIHGKEVRCLVRHPTLERERTVPYTIDVHYAPLMGKIITPEGGTEAREYQCVADANPAPTSFVWRSQSQALPDGVRPKGDRLHFLELNSALNGEYSCEVTNPYGTAVYSIYRYIVDPDDTHNEL